MKKIEVTAGHQLKLINEACKRIDVVAGNIQIMNLFQIKSNLMKQLAKKRSVYIHRKYIDTHVIRNVIAH